MKRAAARLSESVVVVMSVAAADFAMESEPVLSAQQSRGSVQKRWGMKSCLFIQWFCHLLDEQNSESAELVCGYRVNAAG
jgi:hypothetical protein